jgi:hypothetical protein
MPPTRYSPLSPPPSHSKECTRLARTRAQVFSWKVAGALHFVCPSFFVFLLKQATAIDDSRALLTPPRR